MFKRFTTDSLSTAVTLASVVVVLLLMLTASSALAAQGVRPATGHAARRVSRQGAAGKAAGRRDRKHGSATSSKSRRRTHTTPVKRVSPVVPVSPVQPTPIVSPPSEVVEETPVETITPVESEKAEEEKAEEVRVEEERAKEVKAQEEKARKEKAAEEQKLKEEKGAEEKAKEVKAREEQAEAEKAKEEKAREEKAEEEQKLKEEKVAEEKAKEEAAKKAKAEEVKAKEEQKLKEEKAKEEKTSTPENCFENPETEGTTRFEACGYPGPKNAGIEETAGKTECSTLPEYTGSRSIGTAKTKIEGKEIRIDLGSGESGFDVNAAEVTFNKDCLLVTGDGHEGPVIKQDEHGANLLVENSTIRAEGPKLPYSYEKAVDNNYGISAGWKIVNSRVEDCGECVSGFGELSKSYVISNEYVGEESHGLHREDWYLNDETAVVKGSTMFNPTDQTSDIFMDSNNGSGRIACVDKLTVEGSLLAGGGTSIEMCGKEDSKGTSSFTFVDNRIPRCETTPIVKNSGGEEDCSGPDFEGGDAHGYMPHGGAEGVAAFPDVGTVTWSDNYWDNSLEPIVE
jgi:hypothetical protein